MFELESLPCKRGAVDSGPSTSVGMTMPHNGMNRSTHYERRLKPVRCAPVEVTSMSVEI